MRFDAHRPESRGLVLALSLASGLFALTSLLSWRTLTESTAHALPALLVVLVVSVASGLARVLGASTAVAWPLAALAGSLVPLHVASGSLLPTGENLAAVAARVQTELEVVRRFAVPIPEDAGALTLVFTLAALVLVLLLDLLAVSRPWVLAAALCGLAVHVVPANLGTPTPTWQFVLVAGAFVLLLGISRAVEVRRWHPKQGERDVPATPERRTRARGRGRASTVTALAAATAVGLAGVVTLLVPVSHTPIWERGPGSGGNDEVTIANPLADLRRDLTRGNDVSLIRVQSYDGEVPRYLRTAVLTTYDGTQWSTGDRRASPSQVADGPLPSLPGLGSDVGLREAAWSFDALSRFNSRWLPLPENAVEVHADGDWRYDEDTRDFVAWSDDLTTSSLSWDATSVTPELDPEQLDAASSARPRGGKRWTDLPRDLPALVPRLAREVTAEDSTPFRKARALQSWFRSEFTYSLDRVASVGDDDLTAFLSPGGRTGYCEQFAASMALMARSLDIPARVAVGFLEPEAQADGFVFSAHDMHAWPELYFEGAGWVRFEPTPGGRAEDVPEYTSQQLPGESEEAPRPSATPTPSASASPSARPSPSATARPTPEQAPERREVVGVSLQVVVATLGALALLVLVLCAPRSVRARQRRARVTSGDPELWWTELRSSTVDLGLPWPAGASARDQAEALEPHLLPADAGQETSGAHGALGHLLTRLEQHRYAPAGTRVPDPEREGGLAVGTVVETLTAGRSRGRRLVARWMPVSLFRRS